MILFVKRKWFKLFSAQNLLLVHQTNNQLDIVSVTKWHVWSWEHSTHVYSLCMFLFWWEKRLVERTKQKQIVVQFEIDRDLGQGGRRKHMDINVWGCSVLICIFFFGGPKSFTHWKATRYSQTHWKYKCY